MKNEGIDYKQSGLRIRQVRNEQGLSLEQLARRVGISTSHLGHIERGTRIGSADSYLAIATELHVSPDFLLRGLTLWDQVLEYYKMSDDQSEMLRRMVRVLEEEKPKNADFNADGG